LTESIGWKIDHRTEERQLSADCLVDNCLIYLTGRVEKQTAGVNIDLAQSITVRHCSIYDMPRGDQYRGWLLGRAYCRVLRV
jgi:hypothetical protein